MNHPKKRLDAVAEILMGQAPPGESYNLEGDGWPLLAGAGDFKGDHPVAKKFTTEASKISMPGDIIIGVRASIGDKVIADREYCLGRGVAALRARSELHDRYLWHWLSSIKPSLEAKGKGATFKQVTKEDIAELEIPLPPLEEQRRIAAILDKGSALQVLISRREKAFQDIEESLYAALSEQGRTTRSSRAFDFADVFWLQEGPGVRNWQFTAEGVKLLNVGNITPDGKVDLEKTNRHISEEEAFGRYSHFLVDEGDLLMPSSGIPIDEDGLLRTRSAFASAEHLPLCMNTSTIRFKPKMAGASLLFLQGWLQSREFRSQITKLVTGSAQKNFGPSHLKQLQITLPEPSAQLEFEEKLNKIRGLRASLSPSVAEANGLIGSISHRLFAGGQHE